MKIFKRNYYTLANELKNLNFKFQEYLNVNKLYKKINKSFEQYINYNPYSNLPKLHRWCNTTSPIYKDKCDWEKKMNQANIDNSF